MRLASHRAKCTQESPSKSRGASYRYLWRNGVSDFLQLASSGATQYLLEDTKPAFVKEGANN